MSATDCSATSTRSRRTAATCGSSPSAGSGFEPANRVRCPGPRGTGGDAPQRRLRTSRPGLPPPRPARTATSARQQPPSRSPPCWATPMTWQCAKPTQDQSHTGARRETNRRPPRPGPRSSGIFDEVVITGGAGAVGMHFARYLAEHGARRIVLLGRSGADAAR